MVAPGPAPMHEYRTHTCADLGKQHVGAAVRLSGWVNNKRDHGGVLFVDLRDHYGITQIVIPPGAGFQREVAHYPKETVLRFDGTVTERSAETVNPALATGEVEVVASGCTLLASCDPLPFSIFPEEPVPEETRLRYRYLDLRRRRIHESILFRSRVIAHVRSVMHELGFTEYQTPILTSSSPEGARDYLVPSRVHPGKFYALPQAPQQFKQLLMISGFDRYFQIAPCFRDEDARASRSPGEFYQIDMEMSFVTQEDVFAVVERLLSSVFGTFSDWSVSEAPFPRIPYRESLLRYGTDKPDLRIPFRITDLTEHFRGAGFKAFQSTIDDGGVVRAIPVPGIAAQPKSFYDRMVEHAKALGSRGLAYLVWSETEAKGPIAKYVSAATLDAIRRECGVKSGDVVFFVCAPEAEAARIAGEMRLLLGRELDAVEKGSYRFCWIVDFPMYERDAETGKIGFSHNPFSMPQGGLEALQTVPPLELLAWQYDIVCNGEEVSSGAIRNHRPDVMYKAFEIAGYARDEVDTKFAGMVNALRYGAPPHGGIAPGLDRIVMLLRNEPNLREVIAFPMNQKAQDLMMNAPQEVTPRQLEELHLAILPPGPRPPAGSP
jgi:aspartyl-tRNA synthetase